MYASPAIFVNHPLTQVVLPCMTAAFNHPLPQVVLTRFTRVRPLVLSLAMEVFWRLGGVGGVRWFGCLSAIGAIEHSAGIRKRLNP